MQAEQQPLSWWQAKGKLTVRQTDEPSAETVGDFLPEDIVQGLECLSGEWLKVSIAGALRFETESGSGLDPATDQELPLHGFVRVRNKFRELLVPATDDAASEQRWKQQVEERAKGISWLRPPPRSQAVAAQYSRPLMRGGAEEFQRRWELQETVTRIITDKQSNLQSYGPRELKDDLRFHFADSPPSWLESLLSQDSAVVSMLSTAISQIGPTSSTSSDTNADNPSTPLLPAQAATQDMVESRSGYPLADDAQSKHVKHMQRNAEACGHTGASSGGTASASARMHDVPTPLRVSSEACSLLAKLCADSSHFTELLARLPWTDYMSLALMSRAMAAAIRDADWRRLLEILAGEHGLLLPRLQQGHPGAPAQVKEWRCYFNEVWRSRSKWTDSLPSQGFRVRSLARFKPGVIGGSNSAQIFLPLHQRLQLVKLGLDGGFQDEVALRMKATQKHELVQDSADAVQKHEASCHARILSTENERVLVSLPGMGLRYFDFEEVFDGRHGQKDVYCRAALPAVESFLKGQSSCVFCYGQTGSGKTHTMFGGLDEWAPCQENSSVASAEVIAASLGPSVGMAPRALTDILACVESQSHSVSATVELSYIEIYQDHLTDLLSGNDVTLFRVGQGAAANEYREASELGGDEHYHLQGNTVLEVRSAADALQALAAGEHRKHRAATAMNARSSRAHAVLMLGLVQRFKGQVLRSRLHLVDMGGSEQVKKSQAVGLRFDEAVEINSSLMVLSRVVDALVQARSHVPYYESKLTMLLQPALGGNAQTTVMVTASPDDSAADETVHSLRFGERCSRLTNATHKTTASMSEVLASLQSSIAACESEIAALEANGAGERAAAELGDGKLRGLGFGHVESRLIAQSHDDGTSGQEATLAAAKSYTMVEDIAGHWIAQHERLRALKQRQKEILGC